MRFYLRLAAAMSTLAAASVSAQKPEFTPGELAARRAALAEKIGDGVVLAFGGRALVHDFSTFYQLTAFRYLTECNEPDAAFVMVVHNKVGTATLFHEALDPRSAFYYGQRTDSATSLARYCERLARALATVVNLLDPEVIVLGGGLSRVDEIYARVPALMAPHVFADALDTPLRPALHGDSSGVRGAAWLWNDGQP